MNNQSPTKIILSFTLGFFTLPLIINTITGYTWQANLADTFKVSRVITGVIMVVVYAIYQNRKTK